MNMPLYFSFCLDDLINHKVLVWILFSPISWKRDVSIQVLTDDEVIIFQSGSIAMLRTQGNYFQIHLFLVDALQRQVFNVSL